jgi:hypothetical protein
MQRVTFQDPDEGQESALANAVFFKGLTGVHRTRGIKTTGRRQKR